MEDTPNARRRKQPLIGRTTFEATACLVSALEAAGCLILGIAALSNTTHPSGVIVLCAVLVIGCIATVGIPLLAALAIDARRHRGHLSWVSKLFLVTWPVLIAISCYTFTHLFDRSEQAAIELITTVGGAQAIALACLLGSVWVDRWRRRIKSHRAGRSVAVGLPRGARK